MNLEPLNSPPYGPDAVFMLRVSMRLSNGMLVGPAAFFHLKRVPDVVFPEVGSVVDPAGNGIYGVLGNAKCRFFDSITELGEEIVANIYRYQVMSAWKEEIEVDWEFPMASRRTRRAFVIYTGDEASARKIVHELVNGSPNATSDSVLQPLRLKAPSVARFLPK